MTQVKIDQVKISFERVRKEFVTRGEGGGPADRFTALEDISLDVRAGARPWCSASAWR